MKFAGRWGIVPAYTGGIFLAKPYLPQLIRFASSRWARSGVSNFVLWIKMLVTLLILTLGY